MKKQKMSNLAKHEERLGWKMLLPTIIIIISIAIFPLGQVLYTSFTDKTFASNKETSFVGLENYKQLLSIKIMKLPELKDEETGKVKIDPDTNEKMYENPIKILPRKPVRYKELNQVSIFGNRYVIGARDPDFLRSIYNTLVFTITSVFFETLLGLIVALVVNSNFKGRGAMRTIMLVPWAVITVVSARMWEWMFAPSRAGFFNMLLNRVGLTDGQTPFLSLDGFELPAMVLVDVWKTTPYMALLILAGLQTIPDSMYEAAKIDGANKLRQFFSITLPLLKPTIAVALIFRTLDALRVFDLFQVLLGGREYSMATYNHFQLIGNKNAGLASAIGVMIFLIIFGFALLYIRGLGVDSE